MKVLILACLLGLSYVNAQSCEDQGLAVPPQCEDTQDEEGRIICCEINGEGCEEIDCPTDTDTDICYCPTSMPTMATTPSPTTKSYAKKTKGESSGIGYGDCDCDKDYGVTELRFIYQGSADSVTINFYNKDADVTFCTFTGIAPNEEIICESTGKISGQDDFETETYFDIMDESTGEYLDGCSADDVSAGNKDTAAFHTSCSSDIVGLTRCNDNIICSGWKDGNPDDNNDCDDGQEECECDDTETDIETPSPVEDPSTPSPVEDPDTIGDVCYCAVDNCTPSPTITGSTKSSSKGKKGKSKSKSSSKDSGMGCGDCDCDKDYGMVEIRVLYTGADDVTIQWFDKGGDGQICLDSEDVSQGEEAICNVNDYLDSNDDPIYEKLETNTFAKLVDANGDEICTTEIHTSCSRDIVGTEGDGDCIAGLIIVTGWKDGNPNDDNDCDDGYDLCDCEVEIDEGLTEDNPDAVSPVAVAGAVSDNGGYSAYVVANSNSDGELVTSDGNQIRATLLTVICALTVIKLF
eukprot:CAMPEP_0201566366 /NCGR_PEP_ID=MMETSP0190_2-20130828/6106_1 /ASSEMBLY_ACC=CAM_ASM_000263 /TAXON_ID=37353 /ORGANISM="Rosalina sp." /LENGTH=520 /DNA_ID=CAMNT_0047984989 /DNA_START=23 /DNA_END=1585 /DNA_ORIENTATION=-